MKDRANRPALPAFDPFGDPLGRDVVLDHRVNLPVLGVPVSFSTNAAEVLAVIGDVYGPWRSLAARHPELCDQDRAVDVRCIVQPEPVTSPGAVVYRAPSADRLLFATSGSFGSVEYDRGRAVAYVTPTLVSERVAFRTGVLEAVTRRLVSGPNRFPVHAGAVERDGVVLMLLGPSGRGKSTVAYAAGAAGFRVLTEEVVYVATDPVLRPWTFGGPVHLPPDAARGFAELRSHAPVTLPTGKRKVIAPVTGADPDVAPTAARMGLCFLEPVGEATAVTPLDADEVYRRLDTAPEPGFDLFPDAREPVRRRLAGLPAFGLRLSVEPVQAAARLTEIVAALRPA